MVNKKGTIICTFFNLTLFFNFDKILLLLKADMAQLVEQLIRNEQVASSSLAIGFFRGII